MMEKVDLLIVGAGWHGITMAKTYHEVHPNASILIFDNAASIGGVWAEERLYPGLRTNNTIGSYEFSDFPMTPCSYGVEPGSHIPGTVVHRYLKDAAAHFGIDQFLRLGTYVREAHLSETRNWILSYSRYHVSMTTEVENETSGSQILAYKLVIATGLTSTPFIPTIAGRDRFRGFVMHSKQLKANADTLASAKSAVVLGGNKSAWDTCYSVARAGGKAHMILRPSGGGAGWVWPVYFQPLSMAVSRLSATRFVSLFDPWPFDANSWMMRLRGFLHKTMIGQWITAYFWSVLGNHIKTLRGYGNSSSTLNLSPWYSMFWMGNSLSIHNYDSDWFELVRQGKITIHVANMARLSETSVHLSDGVTVDADVVVCCTGWKAEPSIKFSPTEALKLLGLPNSHQGDKFDPQLETFARSSILCERPSLGSPPKRLVAPYLTHGSSPSTEQPGSPYQLYRYMVPPSIEFLQSKNIAFIGMHLALHAVMVAQVQALWITAFFSGRIASLETNEKSNEQYGQIHSKAEIQTALHVEYYKLRRPRTAGGHGSRFPDMVFECISYIDLLMRDLGLNEGRKKRWWEEWFKPYRLVDYKNVVGEWLKKHPEI